MDKYSFGAVFTLVNGLVMLATFFTLTGCTPRWDGPPDFGGQDVVTVHMPFAYGERSQCVQGPFGSYSHTARSTQFDIDFDTPNDEAMKVYAPVSGTAYVQMQDPYEGFGIHINIDLGDGTYILLAHLRGISVEDGQYVEVGQEIGREGRTGYAQGDHVHMGRHRGNPRRNAIHGRSVEGLRVSVEDVYYGVTSTVSVTDLVCGLSDGRVYASVNPTDGSGMQDAPDAQVLDVPDDGTMSVCLPTDWLDEDVSAVRLYAISASQMARQEAFYEEGKEVIDRAMIGTSGVNTVYCGRIEAWDSELVAVNGFAFVGPDPSTYDQAPQWWRHFVSGTAPEDAWGNVFIDLAPDVDTDGDGEVLGDRDRMCRVEPLAYYDMNQNGATDFNHVQVAYVCRGQ